MEHTNLFLFEDKAALDATYPDGEVTAVPGVAYARASEDEGFTVLFNKKITNYTVTLQLQDKSGTTLGDSVTASTPNVLNGETIKYKVVAPEIENYKPRNKEEKIDVSGDTTHTIIYLGLVDYTVTVHHTFSGTPIEGVADTQVVLEDVWDESSVRVTIEPVSIPGYKAEPVTITVSGSCEYNLEYEEDVCYVDLGLPSGTLWACANVGASSPEEYGDYFAWGETTPKESYVKDNYAWYDSSTGKYTKYTGGTGLNLEISDDAAAFNMGGDWHMPTPAQINELSANCTFSLTTYNDVPGIEYTSNVNGKTLFFPGSKVVGENAEDVTGEVGFSSALTWSSCGGVQATGDIVYELGQCFDIYGDTPEVYSANLYYGMPVRGVIGDGPTSSSEITPEIPVQPNL